LKTAWFMTLRPLSAPRVVHLTMSIGLGECIPFTLRGTLADPLT